MLGLINFDNYKIDYADEYPLPIQKIGLTTHEFAFGNIERWGVQNHFQLCYIILSKVFNTLYDISLSIEMTFNPNHYNEYSEASKCVFEGFDFLKSNYTNEDYTQVEKELYESLHFLASLLNQLSPVIEMLQQRNTRTAILLLRSLFSLDLRSNRLVEKKSKFSELIDEYADQKSYLLDLFSTLLEKNAYQHIFEYTTFEFACQKSKNNDGSENSAKYDIKLVIAHRVQRYDVSIEKVKNIGSWIYELMAAYHHHIFPSVLIPGMRRNINSDFSVLNTLLSIVSLELLFMSIEKIETSFAVEYRKDTVPLSRILSGIINEPHPEKANPEHLFYNNVVSLRKKFWEFFIFINEVKSSYENLIRQFISILKENPKYVRW